jgi:hypothetical protein
MKKIKGDEPNEVQYIYTWQYHKEILCKLPLSQKNKTVMFFFLTFLFFFYKIGEQESRAGLPRGRGVFGTSGRGEMVAGKAVGG